MLCAELNREVQKHAKLNANRWTSSEHAPGTFIDLMASSVSPLVVWNGESDRTIYGDPKINHAFRAWHDSIHIHQSLPFTLEGERQVSLIQANQIGGIYADIIIAEIDFQAQYFAQNGHFPLDQVSFMREVLFREFGIK